MCFAAITEPERGTDAHDDLQRVPKKEVMYLDTGWHRQRVVMCMVCQKPLEERKRMEERLWTVSEVAKRLRLDETTVRRYIADGAMEAVILPHKGKRKAYRIKQSTLDTILHPKGRTP